MIQGAAGIQRQAQSFTSSKVCSLVRMDKASDKKIYFISLYVYLPGGSFMGIFLKLINKLESSKWGVRESQKEITQ